MITKEATKLIIQYNSLKLESHELATIMTLRKELVVMGFKLGLEVANYKREFDKANGTRKINFFKIKNENLSEGVTKAETIAEVEIGDLREAEKTYESLYYGCRVILNQLNEVLNAIQQDISILRTELTNGV